MVTNEFRWGVNPAIPGHWLGMLRHEDFEVEIAADWIEVREQDDGQRDIQRARAQQIVEGIVRKIGLDEKTLYRATLGSVSRFDPHTNRRDVGVLLSASLAAKASVHADLTLTSADGTVIVDSRAERMAGLLSFAELAAGNDVLRRMTDYLLDYHSDPHKKLAPLFDIIELAAEAFGHKHKAATLLGIGIPRMKEATGIMHDPSIRSGRHRGRELGQQRDPTPAEAQLCEAVAEQIVREYIKRL